MFQPISVVAAAALLCCSTAHASLIKEIAGPVQQVLVISNVAGVSTGQQCTLGYANIPGAALSITIPAGVNQLLVARFSGHLTATQSSGIASAAVRLVVGTRPLNPDVATNIVASNATAFLPPIMVEGSGPLAPGSHVVRAQFCVDGDNTASATVSGWHLEIEAASAADH